MSGANAGPSRRGLFAGAGVLGAATAVAACAPGERAGTEPAAQTVPFHGAHQAGIGTPAQDRLAFAAYDLTVTGSVRERRAALIDLLRTWTRAAAAMTAGNPVPGDSNLGAAPPADTGEAVGLKPANLTITIGFGPSLFDDRFGLSDRRPAALADLPKLPGEDLDRGRSDGDLAIQACSDDPVVAFHVIRNLARLGRGTVVTRWSQLGFGKASSNGANQQTPRNLMGFKDGTRNIHGEDAGVMNRFVWVGNETDQPWMRGGSYMVARRIAMRIEAWDRDFLTDQQNVFGRFKYSGAPLSGHKEFDTPNFNATAGGEPAIPADAHIRLAAHENNDGVRILRRAYNYTDGVVPSSGELDAGLFFICFQQDPHKQFVALQHKLGAMDALNEYIEHVGSGLFACPPGVRPGQYWGQSLFS